MREPDGQPADGGQRHVTPPVAFPLLLRRVVRLAVEFDGHPLGLVGPIDAIGGSTRPQRQLLDAVSQTRVLEHVQMPPDLELALASAREQVEQVE
jgi:hypothetical protein